MRHNFKESGFTLALSLMAAAAGALLIMAVAHLSKRTSHDLNYLNHMEEVYTLAETGLSRAIGTLTYDVSKCEDSSFSTPVVVPSTMGYHMEYQNTCQRRDYPQKGVFYIVTGATINARGNLYSQILHSYVGISNVSEYFAAIDGDLTIRFPTALDGAKVYASKMLKFNYVTGSSLKTTLKKAEFHANLNPAFDFAGNTQWSAALRNVIEITEPDNNHSPIRLLQPILFPQITAYDLQWYESLAGPHTHETHFSGNVYPPGFYGFNPACGDPAATVSCNTHDGDDIYIGHTTQNKHHVYFSTNDIHIGVRGATTTIHGQILFVTTKNIYIDGNVRSAADTVVKPGDGQASSSTAHQAVFIPGPTYDIFISSNFYSGTIPDEQTQYVEGLFINPTGTIRAIPYDAPSPSPYLRLQFTGSMILGRQPDVGNVFVVPGSCDYSYMQSLADNPPPYLPALSIIYYELPNVTSYSSPYY